MVLPCPTNHGRSWKVKSKGPQSCPTLCDPMDYTVHGILQARILQWVAFPFSRVSSQPRDRTQVSHIAGRFFTSWAQEKLKKTGVGSLSSRSSRPRNWTGVSCVAGGFFTNWAMREAHWTQLSSLDTCSGSLEIKRLGLSFSKSQPEQVRSNRFSILRICMPYKRPGFNPWVGKIPWRRERLPTPIFWSESFHGLHSPWGRKELDTTERLWLFTGLIIPSATTWYEV